MVTRRDGRTGSGRVQVKEWDVHGTGADVMKRIAAPMVGGVVTAVVVVLLVYPAIYTPRNGTAPPASSRWGRARR